jgi:hypothetical protein
LIFAIGGESGGGATVERLSDLPGADDAGRAPPSIEAAPGFDVPAGGAADDFPRAGAAPGVPAGRGVDDSPSLEAARGVAAGFAGAEAAEGFPRVAPALGAATAAAPAEGEPLAPAEGEPLVPDEGKPLVLAEAEPRWAEAGGDAPGAGEVEAAGALARPLATADWSSAA